MMIKLLNIKRIVLIYSLLFWGSCDNRSEVPSIIEESEAVVVEVETETKTQDSEIDTPQLNNRNVNSVIEEKKEIIHQVKVIRPIKVELSVKERGIDFLLIYKNDGKTDTLRTEKTILSISDAIYQKYNNETLHIEYTNSNDRKRVSRDWLHGSTKNSISSAGTVNLNKLIINKGGLTTLSAAMNRHKLD